MSTIVPIPYKTTEDKLFRSEIILDLRDSTFVGVPYQEGTMVLYFSNCRFIDLKIINSEQINFREVSIYFNGCAFDRFEVEFIETDNISLHFSNCLLYGVVRSDKITAVSVNNCIATSLFLIKQKSIDISYTESNIFARIWRKVMAISIVDSVDNLISMKQSYYLYETEKVTFRMEEAKDKSPGFYRQSYHQIEDLKIAYYLNKNQKEQFDINLHLDFSPTIGNANTTISNCILHNLSLKGTATGKLVIENTQIDNWYMHELTFKEEAVFYLISPTSIIRKEQLKPNSKLEDEKKKISIHTSNLDKCWFDNVNFTKYEIVSFYRARIGKALFTGCDFPSNYTTFETFKTLENVHYPDKVRENYYKNQYETFLQLKATLESSGNVYEAQKMQSISYEALRNVDQMSKSDRVILLSNSWSNKHGISIKDPLLWFLSLSIPLYVLYLWSLGRIFNLNPIDWSLIGYYFSFIDVTHRVDFLDEKKHLTGGALFLDAISKIVFSFLIFQFIAAFRKYGKK